MKQLSIWWSKISINSIIQIIVGILWVFSIFYASISFNTYGWEYVVNPAFVLPRADESVRMFMVFLGTIFIFQSCYNIYFCHKIRTVDTKWLVYSVGIFTWLLVPLLIYKGIVEEYFHVYKKHISSNRNEGLQISHKHVIYSIKYGYRKDKLFKNTILAYFTFLATFIGFIIIWIPKNAYTGLPFLSFEVLTFFTQLSNLACFFFMLLFLIFNKKMAFKENTILSNLAAYIAIVSVVFWSVLVPSFIFVKDISSSSLLNNPLRLLAHFWLHTVTPIIFIAFAIRSYVTNYALPSKNIRTYAFKAAIFPAFYAIYAYILPFTIHYSVYGPFTNLNDQMIASNGVKLGYWWMIFVALVGIVIFIIIILLFRWINLWSVRSHQSEARILADKNSFTHVSKEEFTHSTTSRYSN